MYACVRSVEYIIRWIVISSILLLIAVNTIYTQTKSLSSNPDPANMEQENILAGQPSVNNYEAINQ